MRKLSNWIDGFIQYTEGKGSPEIYRLWAAIFTIGAVMERKVWLRTAKGKLYANQYIVLVGGAGIGKSLCTRVVRDLLETLRTPDRPFYIAPTSTTKASLIDALAAAERRIVRPMEVPAVNAFNSLTVIANEFGVFLPSWEGDFMSVLTDLWDCGPYAETRRTHKVNINIPNTQLNIFSATTPMQLTGLLPEGAWEQGFMSRMLTVYSGEAIHTELFAVFSNDDKLWDELTADLLTMYKMWGEVTVSPEAVEAIETWARGGGQPVPSHPKLYSYCARRPAHLLKLCMIACVASGDELTITLDHFAEALDWLVQLETFMPDIFKAMKVGGDGKSIEDCWHYAYTLYLKTKEPVPEARIWHFLQERVPAHSVERIIDVMCRAGLLEKKFVASGTGYLPKTRQAD